MSPAEGPGVRGGGEGSQQRGAGGPGPGEQP